MKLLIICADGHLDPEHPDLPKYPKMEYERKLSIPKELYLFEQPHTLMIWASIFGGRIITKDWYALLNRPARLRFRQYLRRMGLGRFFRKIGVNHKPMAEMIWKEGQARNEWGMDVSFNYDEETVLDHYSSIMWNVPTLDPRYQWGINKDRVLKYKYKEFKLAEVLAYGMSFYPYELGVVWVGILDRLAHLMGREDEIHKKQDILARKMYYDKWREKYMDIHYLTNIIKKRTKVMVLSDHGAYNGHHTEHAYLGCTCLVEADSVLDVRKDIERILDDKK